MIANDLLGGGYPDPLTSLFEGTLEEFRYQETYQFPFVCDVCYNDLSELYDDPDNWSNIHGCAPVFVAWFNKGYHIELGETGDFGIYIYCNRCQSRKYLVDGWP